MKEFRHRLFNSLAFRIIFPVVATVMVMGFVLYLFVLSSISDFADKTIKDAFLDVSHEIYSVCDRGLNELIAAGSTTDEKAVRIKKALTIGMIEDILKQYNFEGSIIGGNNEELLSCCLLPDLQQAVKKAAKTSLVESLEHEGKKYYVYQMRFEPWEWHILFVRSAGEYSFLINKVRYAYMATGGVLLMTTLALLYYLNRFIKFPLVSITGPVRRGELPEYRGIYEFEYLSDTIGHMMVEKEKLMEQIIQERKLKGINVLASGVAHNFNNILVGVLGYISLAKMKLQEARTTGRPVQGEFVDEMLDHLEHAEASADKAGSLARELSVFSKKIAREGGALAPVSINAIVSELKELLLNTFPKNIEIAVSLADDLLIEGDPSQLEQALLNVCVNSRDAMPEGGKLTIETALVNLSDKDTGYPYIKPGAYATVKIFDTGKGIDKETMVHIFEPFFTTKPVDKGTGLGLATVYTTIRAHHGHVRAESSPGKGTSFTIFLPVLKQT